MTIDASGAISENEGHRLSIAACATVSAIKPPRKTGINTYPLRLLDYLRDQVQALFGRRCNALKQTPLIGLGRLIRS